MIDRKTYEEAFEILWRKFTTVGLGGKCHDTQQGVMREALDEILDKANVEVEEPPFMPGISEGEWSADIGGSSGKWIVWSKGNPLAYCDEKMHTGGAESKAATDKANAKFMAGSKEVTEKVIAYLEWLLDGIKPSRRSEKVLEVLAALEKQGCIMDKFRR